MNPYDVQALRGFGSGGQMVAGTQMPQRAPLQQAPQMEVQQPNLNTSMFDAFKARQQNAGMAPGMGPASDYKLAGTSNDYQLGGQTYDLGSPGIIPKNYGQAPGLMDKLKTYLFGG